MTKKKILLVSSKLFFERGIANVRLQQIADEADISVGNLAYHFKNKEAIVCAIYDTAFNEFNQLLDGEIKTQSLEDFDKSIKSLYKFNNQYNFCFINVWEISRNYPQLQEQWETINNNLLSIINKRLQVYQELGIIKSETYKGSYKILSQQLLMNILTWIPFQMLCGKTASLQSFRKNSWSLLVPHFSQKGLSEYNRLSISPTLN
ncbi:MAG: TetR/AcrR family transcriptional regulator [Bacteroidota bacterium]